MILLLAKERIVGFYSTGPKIRKADLEIDELCRLLTKVPSSFSESDRNIINDEFDELQQETTDLLEISNAIHEKPKMKYYSLF